MSGTIGPVVAGTWYPADRGALADLVDRLVAEAGEPPDPRPADVLVAPHAGYVYSGAVAGKAFRSLLGRRVDRVLLLGPSHYAGFAGARVPSLPASRTPLGVVEHDPDVVAAVGRTDDRPFAREHALEAELPFLQRLLGTEIRATPILIGPYSTRADLEEVAAALRPFATGGTVVVVSSDFTHYGRAFDFVPFEREVPTGIERLDRGAIERIVSGDADGFRTYCEETGATICGRHAIEVALRLAPGGIGGALDGYDTSGRMTGDWSHSVSYAALSLRRAA